MPVDDAPSDGGGRRGPETSRGAVRSCGAAVERERECDAVRGRPLDLPRRAGDEKARVVQAAGDRLAMRASAPRQHERGQCEDERSHVPTLDDLRKPRFGPTIGRVQDVDEEVERK